MQQSHVPRRPRRWLRLTALIAGIGALAVVGAALGRGLGPFDTSHAVARAATATPSALAEVAPALAPTAVSPSSPVATGADGLGGEGQFVTPSTPIPSAAAAEANTLPMVAAPTPESRPAGMSSSPTWGASRGSDSSSRPLPARLPKTSDGQVGLGLGALGIALYLTGVALFVLPRMIAGRHMEKE